LSDHISRSSKVEVKIEHHSSSRFTARIGKPRAVVGQSLSTAKGANLPKGKFLDAVTRPKTGGVEFSYLLDQSGHMWCHLWLPQTGGVEFSYLLDQSGHMWCHLWLPLLIIDERRGGGYNYLFIH
jgi:hypothetical protein